MSEHPMDPVTRLPKPTAWAHTALGQILREGDHVLDATVGNGHDTLFLAQRVGVSGHVYGFDLQAGALANTRALLNSSGVSESNVSLFEASHADLAAHLPTCRLQGGLQAVAFNLGYLPGGDKTRTTLAESTLAALDAVRPSLSKGGLLSVVAYPGHPAGKVEAEAVARWMMSLPSSEFEVQHLRALARHRLPPELWLALRLR
jgi:SAM-dependent methyltransferase